MLIGLAGTAGAGKDYAANLIKELVTLPKEDIKKYKFADPLKQFTRKVFDWTEDHTDGDLKETLDERYNITPREALQKLGTEWGRSLYENVWVDLTLREIYRDMTETAIKRTRMGWKNCSVKLAILTDVRFPNEAEAIKEMGGHIIYLKGPTVSHSSTHASETEVVKLVDVADCLIDNSKRDEKYLRRHLAYYLAQNLELCPSATRGSLLTDDLFR